MVSGGQEVILGQKKFFPENCPAFILGENVIFGKKKCFFDQRIVISCFFFIYYGKRGFLKDMCNIQMILG